MTKDFRASQIQTTAIIAVSSSASLPARLLFYPITSEDSSNPNQGQINSGAFDLSGIGADTTYYVSGTKDSRGGSSGGTFVFGGDVHISGTLTGQDGGTVSGGSGWIIVSDIESVAGSVVSGKVFLNASSNMIASGTSDSSTIRARIKGSYPDVTLKSGSNIVTGELSADTDSDSYNGTVDITVSGSGATLTAQLFDPQGKVGPTYNFDVTIETGPELTLLTFGTDGVTPFSYPGSQTELKAGDVVDIYWESDKPVYTINVQDSGACSSATIGGVGGATSGTFQCTVANRGTTLQALAATIRVADNAGAFGAFRATSVDGGSTDGLGLVNLNNLAPSFVDNGVTYPSLQDALKDSETADVDIEVSDFDTIIYSSPVSELTIPATTTYAQVKTVTRLGGTYNISTTNYRIVATRTANDNSNTFNDVVNIADTTATVTVSEPAARLRSGGNDGTAEQSHVITATANQQMSASQTPDITTTHTPAAANTGDAEGWAASWSGGPTSWTRTLRVHDDDPKGTFTWATGSIILYNLARRPTTTLNGSLDYTLGGFVARTIEFPVFSQDATVNVAVITYSKVTAGIFTATSNTAIKAATQGDQTDATDTYTIGTSVGVGLGVNPANLHWNDSLAASTNADPGNLAALEDLEETV